MIYNFFKYGLILVLFFFACEDALSPEGEFFEQFALNCVVRGDSSFQVATVYKSYPNDVSQNTPVYQNFIDDVRIRLWYDVELEDEVYLFRDSSIISPDGDIFKYYYTDNLKIRPGKVMEIEAILPFGKRLIGQTKTPEKIIVEQEYFIPPSLQARDYAGFTWEYTEGERIVHPKMVLNYYYQSEENLEYRQFVIPSELFTENDAIRPFFPNPSYNPYINFKMDAIRWAFEKISEGDPEKSNYVIDNVIVTLQVYDKNLSSYYSATNQFLDDYSVRIDEIDVTNIEGGLGIFGSFIEQKLPVQVSNNFISEYGYRSSK